MTSPADFAAATGMELLVFGLLLGVLYSILGRFVTLPRRITVPAFHTGVLFLNGRAEKTLPSGTHWLLPRRTLELCDNRPTPFQLPSQEYLTGDHMGVRLTLTGEYRIAVPRAFLTASSHSANTFLIELKQALRTAVSELSGQTFLATEHTLPARVRDLLKVRGAELGIELNLLALAEAIPLGWLRNASPATPAPNPPNLPYGPN